MRSPPALPSARVVEEQPHRWTRWATHGREQPGEVVVAERALIAAAPLGTMGATSLVGGRISIRHGSGARPPHGRSPLHLPRQRCSFSSLAIRLRILHGCGLQALGCDGLAAP
ncbi:hypothetical protein ACQJBY_006206 [Aegilops geniculata]